MAKGYKFMLAGRYSFGNVVDNSVEMLMKSKKIASDMRTRLQNLLEEVDEERIEWSGELERLYKEYIINGVQSALADITEIEEYIMPKIDARIVDLEHRIDLCAVKAAA